jgi:hypothetical protein
LLPEWNELVVDRCCLRDDDDYYGREAQEEWIVVVVETILPLNTVTSGSCKSKKNWVGETIFGLMDTSWGLQ